MIRVNTHVGGSFLVVVLTEGGDPTYIDVKTDVRYPDMRFIEFVRAGFVRERDECYKDKLVDRLMSMIGAYQSRPTGVRRLRL